MNNTYRIKVGDKLVSVQRLRKVLWPDGSWRCFCGNQEATGNSMENAVYNFRRQYPPQVEVSE